ncbi:MAG: hypothetical protein AAGI69_15415 [Cyanobacteria bacterium P01_H01_bin.21]
MASEVVNCACLSVAIALSELLPGASPMFVECGNWLAQCEPVYQSSQTDGWVEILSVHVRTLVRME